MVDSRRTCAVCGRVSKLGAVSLYHIIPPEVTREAGVPDTAEVSLCRGCYHELQAWYRARVAGTTYDPGSQYFRRKTWAEKLDDYEAAFNSFKKYMSEKRKSAKKV